MVGKRVKKKWQATKSVCLANMRGVEPKWYGILQKETPFSRQDLTNTTQASTTSKATYGCLGRSANQRAEKGGHFHRVRNSISEGMQTNSSISTTEHWVDLGKSTIFFGHKTVECIWTISSRSATSTIHGRFVDYMIY